MTWTLVRYQPCAQVECTLIGKPFWLGMSWVPAWRVYALSSPPPVRLLSITPEPIGRDQHMRMVPRGGLPLTIRVVVVGRLDRAQATGAVLLSALTYFPGVRALIARTPEDVEVDRFISAGVDVAIRSTCPMA